MVVAIPCTSRFWINVGSIWNDGLEALMTDVPVVLTGVAPELGGSPDIWVTSGGLLQLPWGVGFGQNRCSFRGGIVLICLNR